MHFYQVHKLHRAGFNLRTAVYRQTWSCPSLRQCVPCADVPLPMPPSFSYLLLPWLATGPHSWVISRTAVVALENLIGWLRKLFLELSLPRGPSSRFVQRLPRWICGFPQAGGSHLWDGRQCIGRTMFVFFLLIKLRGCSPQANYTDRSTAACRRS
jgi:hypothetical protein